MKSRKSATTKTATTRKAVKTTAITKKPVKVSAASTRRSPAKTVTRRRPKPALVQSPAPMEIPAVVAAAEPLPPQAIAILAAGSAPQGRNRRIFAATMALAGAAVLLAASVIAVGSPAPDRRGNEPASIGPASLEERTVGEKILHTVPAGKLRGAVEATIRRVRESAPDLGSYDTEWAHTPVATQLVRIGDLYNELRSTAPGTTGIVAVHMEIEPSGHVGRAWVEENTTGDAGFAHSVLRELIRVGYGHTGFTAPVGVMVPIAFDGHGANLAGILAHAVRMPGESGGRMAALQAVATTGAAG